MPGSRQMAHTEPGNVGTEELKHVSAPPAGPASSSGEVSGTTALHSGTIDWTDNEQLPLCTGRSRSPPPHRLPALPGSCRPGVQGWPDPSLAKLCPHFPLWSPRTLPSLTSPSPSRWRLGADKSLEREPTASFLKHDCGYHH